MVKPRPPVSTVQFIDSYCQLYQNLFSEVRSFEHFKYLHLGMISDIKRKTLPAIAKIVGLDNEQSLHHFLTESPWSAKDLRTKRLEVILNILQGRSIILIIDETGDQKKGKSTDYVKRQYIGNIGKIESGIVAVTAYGYLDGITFPLTFEVFKRKERLKESDKYKTNWYVMTYIPGVKYQEIGNLFGIRTWIEYGLKQSKNELGWADFRVTNYSQIEKWWEIVMSAYLMVSPHSDRLNQSLSPIPDKFIEHELWDFKKGWKNLLNNLHLIIQPFIYFNLIKRWLKVFPIPQLSWGFPRLISLMNLFDICDFTSYFCDICYYSTA